MKSSHLRLASQCCHGALRSLIPVVALLGLSAVLLFATGSAATADEMTYNVISNPQTDIHNVGYEVDISGTLTVDNTGGSAIGTFDSSNDSDVSIIADLTMTTTAPGVNPITIDESVPLATAFSIVNSSQLFATATGLSIGSDTYFELSIGSMTFMDVKYDTHDNDYYGYAGVEPSGATMQFENMDGGQYLVGGEWEIAAVPEPGTLTLLASGLLGLGVVCLQRRGSRTT